MRSTVTVQVKDQRPGYIQASLGLILMESKFPESHAQTLISIWPVVESGLNAFQVGEYIYGGTCPQTR